MRQSALECAQIRTSHFTERTTLRHQLGQPKFLPIEELLQLVTEPNREPSLTLLKKHEAIMRAFARPPGQPWAGGLYDHIRQSMNMASYHFDCQFFLRPIASITRSDALLVVFLHEFNNIWCFQYKEGDFHFIPEMEDAAIRRKVRDWMFGENRLALTRKHLDALNYIESNGRDGLTDENDLGTLAFAEFCRYAVITSSIICAGYPSYQDPWKTAVMSNGNHKSSR